MATRKLDFKNVATLNKFCEHLGVENALPKPLFLAGFFLNRSLTNLI